MNNIKFVEGEDFVDVVRVVGEKIVVEYGVGEGFDVVLECIGVELCI